MEQDLKQLIERYEDNVFAVQGKHSFLKGCIIAWTDW